MTTKTPFSLDHNFEDFAKKFSQLTEGDIERAIREAAQETGQLLVQELRQRINRHLAVSTKADYSDPQDSKTLPKNWAEASDLAQYIQVFPLDGGIVVGIPPGIMYKGHDASDLAFGLDYSDDPIHPATAILKTTLRDMEHILDADFSERLTQKIIKYRRSY